jgi:hypothetical protein
MIIFRKRRQCLIVCELWERLDGVQNLSTQLDQIIDGAEDLETWREAFVRTPAAIGYCQRHLIRRGDYGEVYLLQTTQMNGKHAELFTYCLYENMRTTLKNNGSLNPLAQLVYQSIVGADVKPGISLLFTYDNNQLQFEIEFNVGKFDIYISCEQVKPFPLIEATLVNKLGFVRGETLFRKSSTSELIESSIREMAKKLAMTARPKR